VALPATRAGAAGAWPASGGVVETASRAECGRPGGRRRGRRCRARPRRPRSGARGRCATPPPAGDRPAPRRPRSRPHRTGPPGGVKDQADRREAELLASAVAADAADTAHALRQVAADRGRELAADGPADLVGRLTDLGFEPYEDGEDIRLRNCPFHSLARTRTELVCAMNLALLTGLTQALAIDAHPRLDPAPGRCCVALPRP
jgi:hypothetical protein